MKTVRDYKDARTGASFRVEFDVDLEAIFQTLAARAWHNRTRKATTLEGSIKARVLDGVVFFTEPPDRPDMEEA